VLNILKSGSLNLLAPSGPVQASNGIALPFTTITTTTTATAATTTATHHHHNGDYYYYYYYYL